jgi:hypothetical protein
LRNPGKQRREYHFLIERVNRIQALRWALDYWLPQEFHGDVKIVGEEVVS